MNLLKHGSGAILRRRNNPARIFSPYYTKPAPGFSKLYQRFKHISQFIYFVCKSSLHTMDTVKHQRIFLIGFMGTGKSHWGKLWAQKNGMGFYDMDELIEQAENQTVVDIFENAGEDYFRVKEASILRSQLEQENCIIACGGGAACFNGNMEWMNEHGFTVYLTAPASFLLQRIMDEKEKRPLVKNVNEAELLFFIEQKLKEREPFYNQAKAVLDATTLTENSLAALLSLK
jgi:shikimate kinase